MAFDLEMIRAGYGRMGERLTAARAAVGRPLTLTEKILYSHLFPAAEASVSGGGSGHSPGGLLADGAAPTRAWAEVRPAASSSDTKSESRKHVGVGFFSILRLGVALLNSEAAGKISTLRCSASRMSYSTTSRRAWAPVRTV